MNLLRIAPTPLALLALAMPALAQSINLDVNVAAGEGAGTPPSTYQGAAGQPGYWNAVSAATPSLSNLLGLDGQLSGVTLSRTTTMSSYVSVPDPDTTGSFALLMDDVQAVPTGQIITYNFGNLDAGTYAVFTYAPQPAGQSQIVTVQNSSSYQDSQSMSGEALGPLGVNEYGFLKNYTVMLRTVTQGGLISVVINGSDDPAYLAGIQLHKVDTGRFRLFANDNPPVSGLKTGRSWADADPDLDRVLTIAWYAGPGVDVWVAGGAYKPNMNFNSRSADFYVGDGVHLYGGFNATETSLNQRFAPGTVVSTLSGEIGAATATDNSYNVLNINNADDVIVDNFTITRGYANGTINGEDTGAALQASGSGAVIRHCVFRDNTSTNDAPLYVRSFADVRFEFCTFIDNFNFNSRGGGVSVRANSSANFVNCRFLGNNSFVADGGGLFVDDCPVTLTNCLFSGNVANAETSRGGALFATGSSASVDMRNCTVGFNLSLGNYGGVVAVGGADLDSANSIFWGNMDASGSGSVSDNFAAVTPATGNLQFSVIQGSGTVTNPGFTHAVGPDTVFGTLDDDYTLRVGVSQIIDAGKNLLLPLDTIDLDNDGVTFEFTPYDLAGRARLKDINSAPNTGEGTPPVDIGAYEAVPPPCIGDFNADGQRDTADLVIFLGQFGDNGNLLCDLNDDNTVNTADLTIFLGVFGDPCP